MFTVFVLRRLGERKNYLGGCTLKVTRQVKWRVLEILVLDPVFCLRDILTFFNSYPFMQMQDLEPKLTVPSFTRNTKA